MDPTSPSELSVTARLVQAAQGGFPAGPQADRQPIGADPGRARVPDRAPARQVARAVDTIAAGAPGPIALAGHSAGGHLVARALEPGLLAESTAERLISAVRFASTTVGEVMIPIGEVIMLRWREDLDAAIVTARKHGFFRLPVY